MKVLKWFDEHFEEVILVVLLVLISCVELIQVICRNVDALESLRWPEEFCRFCWIWSVFVSLPYTIRKGNMLRVSILLDLFTPKMRSIINIFVDVVTAAAMLLLGVHSIDVVGSILKSGETSPAMVWPMWIIYSIMLPGFFLGVLRGLQQAYLHVKTFGKDMLSTTEQTMADAEAEAKIGREDLEGGKA